MRRRGIKMEDGSMQYVDTAAGNMPELGWSYGYVYFWCIAATVVVGLYIWMKRKGWF